MDLADFNRFDWNCVDLGCFERLTMDLEDRLKFILFDFEDYVGFVRK